MGKLDVLLICRVEVALSGTRCVFCGGDGEPERVLVGRLRETGGDLDNTVQAYPVCGQCTGKLQALSAQAVMRQLTGIEADFTVPVATRQPGAEEGELVLPPALGRMRGGHC